MVKVQKPKPAKLSKSSPEKFKGSKIVKVSKMKKSPKLKQEYTEKAVKFTPKECIDSLDVSNFPSGIKAFCEMYSKTSEGHNKKQLLDNTNEPVFLQINAIKIPKCRDHAIRVDLTHSCQPKDLEICLITADLPNTNLRDYDKAVDHYETILKSHNITNIKEIMTFHQVRNEYQEFEMKRKFASAYDLFLADSKIHGKVVHILGSSFTKAHKTPRVLDMDKTDLKARVERVISQTDVKINSKGNCIGIQVGLVSMTPKQILANANDVVTQLQANYPGGVANIRSINIKTTKSIAVPLYLTMKKKSEVNIPIIKTKQPNAFKTYMDELSTVPNMNVVVLPSGAVQLKKIKKEPEIKFEDDEKQNFAQLIKTRTPTKLRKRVKKEAPSPEAPKTVNRKIRRGKKKAASTLKQTLKVVTPKTPKTGVKVIAMNTIKSETPKKTPRKATAVVSDVPSNTRSTSKSKVAPEEVALADTFKEVDATPNTPKKTPRKATTGNDVPGAAKSTSKAKVAPREVALADAFNEVYATPNTPRKTPRKATTGNDVPSAAKSTSKVKVTAKEVASANILKEVDANPNTPKKTPTLKLTNGAHTPKSSPKMKAVVGKQNPATPKTPLRIKIAEEVSANTPKATPKNKRKSPSESKFSSNKKQRLNKKPFRKNK